MTSQKLTPGMNCVDLRKFFQHRDNSIRPSKLGIALTFNQWDALMDAATTIDNELDGFKAISPCWHAADDELVKCNECTLLSKLFQKTTTSAMLVLCDIY